MNHKGTVCIETKRLVLRMPSEDDYANLYKYLFSDEQGCKLAGSMYFDTKEKMIEKMEEYRPVNEKADTYAWTIFLKDGNIPIGSIGVHTQEDNMLNCQVGYYIHHNYYNQGYATEALKDILRFLIKEVGYNRVSAKYRGNNIASGRVMEKAGMNLEGVERQSYYKDGKFLDRHVYSIIKKDLIDQDNKVLH